jgi:hypothetical protein
MHLAGQVRSVARLPQRREERLGVTAARRVSTGTGMPRSSTLRHAGRPSQPLHAIPWGAPRR